jgi:hypothetical protein
MAAARNGTESGLQAKQNYKSCSLGQLFSFRLNILLSSVIVRYLDLTENISTLHIFFELKPKIFPVTASSLFFSSFPSSSLGRTDRCFKIFHVRQVFGLYKNNTKITFSPSQAGAWEGETFVSNLSATVVFEPDIYKSIYHLCLYSINFSPRFYLPAAGRTVG